MRRRFAWWRLELPKVLAVRVEVLSSAADATDGQVVVTATVRAWGLASYSAQALTRAVWFDGSFYWRVLTLAAVSERAWVDVEMRRGDRGSLPPVGVA